MMWKRIGEQQRGLKNAEAEANRKEYKRKEDMQIYWFSPLTYNVI
jgi:hypothetical protein